MSNLRQWAGSLPASWRAAELRRVADISASNVDKNRSEDEIPVRLCNYTDVYYNDVIYAGLDFMEATATQGEIGRFKLQGGEVLLTKDSESAEDIAIPAYVQPGLENVVCGYHLYVLRPKPDVLDGRFLARACSVSPIRDQFVVAANGITRYGLGQQDLGSAVVPIPPIAVQEGIADFLDRETARIDRLIEQKRRLLGLLDEKRATQFNTIAIGTHLDSEFRPTGNPLFPLIPAHWHLVKLRRVLTRVRREVSVRPAETYREIGIRSWGKGIFHKGEVSGKQIGDKSVFAVAPGDFVLNIVFAWEGAVAVVSHAEAGMIASHRFPTFRHNASICTLDYLLLFFQSDYGRALLALHSPGAAGRNRTIRLSALLTEEIPLPPVEEQGLTAQSFRQNQSSIAALVTRVDAAIDLLREWRAALVSSAVTGKILPAGKNPKTTSQQFESKT